MLASDLGWTEAGSGTGENVGKTLVRRRVAKVLAPPLCPVCAGVGGPHFFLRKLMLAPQERRGSPYVLALLGDNSYNSLGY